MMVPSLSSNVLQWYHVRISPSGVCQSQRRRMMGDVFIAAVISLERHTCTCPTCSRRVMTNVISDEMIRQEANLSKMGI
jgi:hypothetical protein